MSREVRQECFGLKLQDRSLRHTEWWLRSPCLSQWPHFNDINLRGLSSLGGLDVQLVEVIAGDDEDDGGGAEGHPLFGSPFAAAALAGYNDRSDRALDARQGVLFEVALQPREPRAQQLQQAAPEL